MPNEKVKVVIEVSGGVVQDVYAGDFVDVILVDWDNIEASRDEDLEYTEFAGHFPVESFANMPDETADMIRRMDEEDNA